MNPLLTLEDARIALGTGRHRREVVHGVGFDVRPGEIVGLVGESGSGKSTVARACVGLVPLDRGRLLVDGREIGPRRADRRRLRSTVQLVFQDPRASLDPRMRVGEAIGEAVAGERGRSRSARRERVGELLQRVGLDPAHADARPGALSGGQRQRVSLARALAAEPRLIIADEITSALDASVQGAVLNLLRELRRDTGLGLLVISHDLEIVRYLSDRVVVMRHGDVVEQGETDAVLERPEHPYTQTLVAAAADGA